MYNLNKLYATIASYYGVSVEELDSDSSLVRNYFMDRMGRPHL